MKPMRAPGFTSWAEEFSWLQDQLADDPREQEEAEDEQHRYFDFVSVATTTEQSLGDGRAETEGSGAPSGMSVPGSDRPVQTPPNGDTGHTGGSSPRRPSHDTTKGH